MFYTAAWCSTNEDNFRRSMPFELLGESIRKYGSSIPFNIVLLEGIELLSRHYLSALEKYGFVVVDYCDEYRRIVDRFKSIDSFYSTYERNCFLRWIAFKQIRNAHGDLQFWHLDSDVILHTSLGSLAAETKGKTFMLQGCPVFVSVSDSVWFDSYERELEELNTNIIAYSKVADARRNFCRSNDLFLANESSYRYPIGSDQDLLEYLVSSKKIIQAPAAVIYNSKYYYIQNPLSLKKWHLEQASATSMFEEGNEYAIMIDSKKVPFIHYQNTFSAYAGVYCLQKRMGLSDSIIKKFFRFKITNTAFRSGIYYKVFLKLTRWVENPSREDTIKLLMNNKARNQKKHLINLLNLLLSV
jgi:hypothetical protein